MSTKINKAEMISFYEQFDAVDFKYRFLLYEKGDVNTPICNYDDRYRIYQRHEYAYQISELTKKNYGGIRANLDLVYAKREMTDEVVKIFDLVMHKLINQYINIDGIERMFSEKYVDFEWDMHLGIDYSKHSMNFYRDHFIHQVRNAYMMHKLLEEGYEQYVIDVLENEANGKISRFVYKHLLQQEENAEAVVKEISMTGEEQEEVIRKHYLRNIIYMSCYMAALFHDIGYPESANMINRRRITEYISNIYNLETSQCDFNRISTLLQNSLLFRVVSVDEIRKKIECNKPDHGALSAIIFLMHFYENGAIHRLEPYKLCAVELAGLAIYNHTAKYMHGNKKLKKEDATHYKSSFLLNPISYMLRVCDDMQEWDRIYFEISDNSNLIVCNKCKTPIVRTHDQNGVYYHCNCNSIGTDGDGAQYKNKAVFEPIFKYDAFPYRRIYNVTVCDDLEWEKEGGHISFKLKYDLENLLHVAYINSSYAKYRIKELNQMKYLFDYQSVIPKATIEYFVSANPILIKVKIIEKWLRDNRNDVLNQWRDDYTKEIIEAENIDEALATIESMLLNAKADCNIEYDMFYDCVIDEKYSEKLKRYMGKTLDLYCGLCWFLYLYEQVNCDIINDESNSAKKILSTLAEKYRNEIQNDRFFDEDSACLINDCLKQFEGMYEDISKLEALPGEYYTQFQEDKSDEHYLYTCCDSFTSTEKYIPLNERNELLLDAFTDLYMFHKMME